MAVDTEAQGSVVSNRDVPGSASERVKDNPKHMAEQAAGADVEMDTQALPELTPQSAKIGRWMLRVCTAPKEEDYQYIARGKQVTGKVFSCYFVGKDSSHYCLGKYRRKANTPQTDKDFAAAKNPRSNCVDGIQGVAYERQATIRWIHDQTCS